MRIIDFTLEILFKKCLVSNATEWFLKINEIPILKNSGKNTKNCAVSHFDTSA